MRRAMIVACGLALGAGAAQAASCGEEIQRLAAQYQLMVGQAPLTSGKDAAGLSAPATTESQGIPPNDRLARSGGEVKPPDTGQAGKSAVITPPDTGPNAMATAPKVEPQASSGTSTQNLGSAAGLDAAGRARMEALLTAARSAEQQGQNEQCFERVKEAEQIPHPGKG